MEVSQAKELNTITLFEYRNKVKYDGDFAELDTFLDEVWSKREKNEYFRDNEGGDAEAQKFISYFHKSGEIKSNKYVGVIRFNDKTINLMPKIFYEENKEYDSNEIMAMHNHILWWLSYCRKIKFPKYQTGLSETKSDFFEILIYLFANYTRDLLASSVYQQYQEIDTETSFIKGRLNVNDYIKDNISQGNWHKFSCTYDSFIMDNKFNRIIKYVAIMLSNATNYDDNKRILRDIIFTLDEVTYEQVNAADCTKIIFNPMFDDFATVRDYCYLFLNNSVSFNYKNDLKLFAFLLPMEYVFEDFLFGFIAKEIEHINVKAQSTNTYLVEVNNYSLRPDLVLEYKGNKFIADTKYKIIYNKDNKSGTNVSQSDLYQMLAYAVRLNTRDICLFYPETITNHPVSDKAMIIKDELADGKEIKINIIHLPIINSGLFESKTIVNEKLSDIFEGTRQNLVIRLERVFSNIKN